VKQRMPIAFLALSALGLTFIATDEGYRDAAYNDGGGVQTLGFGTTTHPDGSPIKRGDKTNPVRALIDLQGHVNQTEAAMRQCLGAVPLHPHEWDAYVRLSYNIGSTAFCGSTLVKKLHQTPPDYAGACKEILRWNKDNGRVIPGLTARREREYRQCVGESIPPSQPSPIKGEGINSPSPLWGGVGDGVLSRGEGASVTPPSQPSPVNGEGAKSS